MKNISVSGICLRGCGNNQVEVLAEIEGEWIVVIPEQYIEFNENGVCCVSHTVHPLGMLTKYKEQLKEQITTK